MSYAEDEADVEGTVNGVTATTTGTSTPFLYLLLFTWGFIRKASCMRSRTCCWRSVNLCPGGGSSGKWSEGGQSRHDWEEADLKQEGGFLSKLKKFFSSSWQPQTR